MQTAGLREITAREYRVANNFRLTFTNYSQGHPYNAVRLYQGDKCLEVYEMNSSRNIRAYLLRYRGKHWKAFSGLCSRHGLDEKELIELLETK